MFVVCSKVDLIHLASLKIMDVILKDEPIQM